MATLNNTDSEKAGEAAADTAPPPLDGRATEDEKTEDDDDKKSEVFEKDDGNESVIGDNAPDIPTGNDLEESEEKVVLGSLDRPIEILTDKRDRKGREILVIKHEKKPAEDQPDYSHAEGTMISKIPYAKYQINQEPDEDLITLHQLMYRKQPKYINWARSGILKFKGFPFDENSKWYLAHLRLCERLTKAGVRYINELLGVAWKDRSREEMISDLLEFLKSPKDLGMEIPAPPPPKPKPKKVKKQTRRRKGRGAPLPKGYVEVWESEPDEEEGESSEEEGGDGRRKSRRVSVKIIKKTPAKKVPVSKTAAKKTIPAKKTPAKKASATKKGPTSRGTSSSKKGTPVSRSSSRPSRASKRAAPQEISDSSDDEEVLVKSKRARKSPAKKATPKKPPNKQELKRTIADLLKDADLAAVTMKKILNQVYDKYSDYDLTEHNEFLKKTVKDCL